jgi:phosphate transport system protein
VAKHLLREIDNLKKMILALSAVVEVNVQKAVRSIEDLDRSLANEVIGADSEVDRIEVEVEEECLKILALHQPVAIDLRFIIAVLKINNDLERIGDLAVNIAERALFLCYEDPIAAPFELAEMCRKTLSMLRTSLDALMNLESDMAHEVRLRDDEVDEVNREMYIIISERIRANPEHTLPLLSYVSASRHLERIADYATNIAEDLIYMIEGDIVRHGVDARPGGEVSDATP